MKNNATVPAETLFDWVARRYRFQPIHEMVRLSPDMSLITRPGMTLCPPKRLTSSEIAQKPTRNGTKLAVQFEDVSFEPRIRELHGGCFVA